MTITSESAVRIGEVTEITVVSDLSGTVYYHWYVDGVWAGMSTEPRRVFYALASQMRVEVTDTNDADYDGQANAPAGYSSRRELYWIRSVDADVDYYDLQQRKDGGDWATIAIVHQAGQWEHRHLTGVLEDLATYGWQAIPVDTNGNEGTAVQVLSEKVVRRPDAPDFTVSFDEGTTRITFAEAA